jgi:hypothetical protein
MRLWRSSGRYVQRIFFVSLTGHAAAFLTQAQENQPEAIKTAREWTQQYAQKK